MAQVQTTSLFVSLLKILKLACYCVGRTFRQVVSHRGEFLSVLLYWPPLNSSPNQSDVPISTSCGLVYCGLDRLIQRGIVFLISRQSDWWKALGLIQGLGRGSADISEVSVITDRVFSTTMLVILFLARFLVFRGDANFYSGSMTVLVKELRRRVACRRASCLNETVTTSLQKAMPVHRIFAVFEVPILKHSPVYQPSLGSK